MFSSNFENQSQHSNFFRNDYLRSRTYFLLYFTINLNTNRKTLKPITNGIQSEDIHRNDFNKFGLKK